MKRSLFVVFSVLLVLALSLGASAQGVVTMMGVWGRQNGSIQEVMEAFMKTVFLYSLRAP